MLAWVLALMLFAPAALANDTISGYYTPPAAYEGQYPIRGKGVKLTYWAPIADVALPFISNYDENPAWRKVQEETGVDIEFIHPAVGTEREAFQLLLTGELPDMIQLNSESFYSGGLQALYDDGLIIDIAPYLATHAPQYYDLVNADDQIHRAAYPEGRHLAFYQITRHAAASVYHRVNTNKDWLAEMGVAEPTTIAEYEAYFDWILANKPGVIPLYMGTVADSGSTTMNLFTGAFDFLFGWHVTREDDTRAGYWANAEGYKDFLVLMKRWYDRGYLGRDFIGTTLTEAQALFDQGKLGCICDSVDATYTRVRNLESGGFTVTNFPYMRRNAGDYLGSGIGTNPLAHDFFTVITTACDNVEAAVQFLNYGYTFEGSLTYNFGVEGKAWVWGGNGVPQFTELITNNPDGMTISNASYCLKAHFATRYRYPDAIAHPSVASDPEALRMRTMWAGDARVQNWLRLPAITLTGEENEERSALMAQVDTYAKEMMIKFIMGAESLDNYDQYIETVNRYGLARATEITQAALDRYYGISR